MKLFEVKAYNPLLTLYVYINSNFYVYSVETHGPKGIHLVIEQGGAKFDIKAYPNPPRVFVEARHPGDEKDERQIEHLLRSKLKEFKYALV